MEIGNQLLFFFAGLGVFNGLLLAIYFLFVVKPKQWVNVLFGLMMLMLCIRIGKSLFYIFTEVDRIYLQLGLSACILIGPLLFLYVRRFLATDNFPKKSDWPHLLIPLFLVVLVGVSWPYETQPAIWSKYIVRGIYGVWVLYTILSCMQVIPTVKQAMDGKTSLRENWILLVVSCMLLVCIAYNAAYYGFPYLSGPLLFSLVFYVWTGFLFSKKNRSLILQPIPDKYQHQKVSDPKAEALLNRLSDLMESQQSYLNHKIKLAQLAESIDSTPHEVSQVINDRLGISFNHYINEFRVREACQRLQQSDHLTIEGIGQEVGFSSRSTFYQAFKTLMNQTPAQYRNQIKQTAK